MPVYMLAYITDWPV